MVNGWKRQQCAKPVPPGARVLDRFPQGKDDFEPIGARFSPDGTLLVTWNGWKLSAQNKPTDTVSAYNVRTGRRLWSQPNVHARAIKFSADGHTLVTAESQVDYSFELRLRDPRTGLPLPGPAFANEFGPWGFAPSPDGRLLAQGTIQRGREILIRDVATGRIVRKIPGVDFREAFSWDVAFSPSGRYIAARPDNDGPGYGLYCSYLAVFDVTSGRSVYRDTAPGYQAISGVSDSLWVCLDPAFFLADGRLVFGDSFLDMENPGSGPRRMTSGDDTRMGEQGYRLFVGLADMPDSGLEPRGRHGLFRSRFYESSGKNGDRIEVDRLELWDIEERRLLRILPGPTNHHRELILDYSPPARLMARFDGDTLTLEAP